MGLKEKMMENMMSKMSPEEKKEMMNAMMEKFFGNMTEEEKREMMGDMMPRMMQMMTGKEGGGSARPPMMGMMEFMMGGGRGKEGEDAEAEPSFNPMEMCGKMMTGIERSGSMAALSTPEIQTLFEEWAAQVQEEILKAVRQDEKGDLEKMAEKLKISKKSLVYFIARLAQQGKIDLTVREHKQDK